MKILLFVACLCCLASVTRGQAPAWPLDPATHRISYQAVVPVPGVSQAELLARASGWARGATSVDTAPVLTHEADAEVLVLSGASPFSYAFFRSENGLSQTNHLVVHYTLRLWLREGSYRYQATDFTFSWPPSPTREPAENDLIEMEPLSQDGATSLEAERTRFRKVTATLLTQLQEAMRQPSSPASGKVPTN